MRSYEEKPGIVRGSCFCEAVTFELALPTTSCVHCHCTMCQRANGAGYVTWVAAPKGQFRLTSGDEGLSTYHSSDHGQRSFCSRCGSSLFCELTEHPDQIDITLANFHDKIDRAPQAHVYFSDRAEWVSVDERLRRLGGKTGIEPL
jgi:hypothetical protein